MNSSQQNNGICLLIDVASTSLGCRNPGEFVGYCVFLLDFVK